MADDEKEIQGLKQALLHARQEIEKLARIKADFISIISHELKTPLTSIKESVALILDGIAGPVNEEQKKFLTIAKNNIERLVRLINDILDFSKLEAGRIIMHKKKIDANEVIKNVYSVMKTNIEQKNLKCELQLHEAMQPTWLDPDRISQVFKNLLSNAIKFSKENGSIRIHSSLEDINNKRFVKIRVEDDGIGVPQEEIENLFKDFSQLDTSMTRKHTGIGLGLAISKGIVELHGGDIWVMSEEGTGSRFIFTLPVYGEDEEFNFLIEEAMERSRYSGIKLALIIFAIKNPEDRNQKMLQEIEETIKKTVRGPEDKVIRYKKGEFIVIMAGTDRKGAMVIIDRLRQNIKCALDFGISMYPDDGEDKDELIKKAGEDLKSGKNSIIPKKILLIIDDEEDLTSMLSFRLRNMGFETLTANDGIKGMELALERKPDIIILDIMMPQIDGLEVTKRLKEEKDTHNIPILVFTALKKKGLQEDAISLGAVDYIEKPFEPEDLVKKINKILEVENG